MDRSADDDPGAPLTVPLLFIDTLSSGHTPLAEACRSLEALHQAANQIFADLNARLELQRGVSIHIILQTKLPGTVSCQEMQMSCGSYLCV